MLKYYGPLLILFLSLSQPASAQIQLDSDGLIGDFWYNGDLFFPKTYDLAPRGYGSLTEEQFTGLDERQKFASEAAVNLLEEARILFSALIYGYRFDYTPGDKQRQVTERFELILRHEIPVGDPHMVIEKTTMKELTVHSRIRYHLSSAQMALYKQRSFAAMQEAGAVGTGALTRNFDGRMEAVRNAAKETVRAYMRRKLQAKPRRITGEIFLADIPRIVVARGVFRTTGRFIFKINETEEHRIP